LGGVAADFFRHHRPVAADQPFLHGGILCHGALAITDEKFKVAAVHHRRVLLHAQCTLHGRRRAKQLSLLGVHRCQRGFAPVEARIQIINQRFLAHVVHNFTRGIKGALRFAILHIQQVFKHLAKHLRVHGHFTFQRLVLAHGKVVQVESCKNLAKNIVADAHIRVLPVVAVGGFKQAAVQERDVAIERRVKVIRAFYGQGFVKQGFQQVVKEIDSFLPVLIQLLQEIARPAAPCAAALYAQPALLLQKIQEHNLPEQLFGKPAGVNLAAFKFGTHLLVTCKNVHQFIFELLKQPVILLKELTGDRFDIKGVFNIRQAGVGLAVLQNGVKLLLGGMVGFINAHQKRITPGRG